MDFVYDGKNKQVYFFSIEFCFLKKQGHLEEISEESWS